MMRLVIPWVLLLYSVCVPVYSQAGTVQNKPVTTQGEQQQIATLFAEYMRKYNFYLQHKTLPATPELYTEQLMLMLGSRAPAVLPRQEFAQGLNRFLDGLKDKGVAMVEWQKVTSKILNDNTAIASNVAVRYLDNGEIYNKVGATYFLSRTKSGWRISAFSVHKAQNVLF